MALLGEQEQKIVRDRLANLEREVESILFVDSSTIVAPGKEPCVYCKETRQLMEEFIPLTDKLSLVVHDIATEEGKQKAVEMKVEAVPTLIMRAQGSDAVNLRYRGIPAGYEFASLLEDIEMIGRDGHGLPEDVVATLEALPSEVNIQVFVTPTCPYCPQAVRTAHRFAYASPKVTGEMVEAQEFPALSQKHNIGGVPDAVINGGVQRVLGAQPVSAFLDAVKRAVVVEA